MISTPRLCPVSRCRFKKLLSVGDRPGRSQPTKIRSPAFEKWKSHLKWNERITWEWLAFPRATFIARKNATRGTGCILQRLEIMMSNASPSRRMHTSLPHLVVPWCWWWARGKQAQYERDFGYESISTFSVSSYPRQQECCENKAEKKKNTCLISTHIHGSLY